MTGLIVVLMVIFVFLPLTWHADRKNRRANHRHMFVTFSVTKTPAGLVDESVCRLCGEVRVMQLDSAASLRKWLEE